MPLYITKRGEIWYIRGTVTVGKEKKAIYQSTGVSDKESADQQRAALEASLRTELLHGPKHVRTFEEAAVAYIESGGSERFLAEVNGRLGARRLIDLGQADIDAAAREAYPNASIETRNRQFYTPFIATWNYAEASGWAEPRRWRRPKKVRGTNVVGIKQRAGTRPVDYQTAGQFVAAMTPAPAMVMATLFFTGMRPIEVFLLHANFVSIANRWIVLENSKTGESRGVPIHDFLVPILEPLVERGGLLFRTVKGKPYPPTEDGGGQMKTAINGARARLIEMGTPIPGISPYTARHSVSTQLVINGVHPHIKDQILGHAVDDMSRHYTQVPQQPLIEAINTIQVPDVWRRMEWLSNPVAHQRKLLRWGSAGRANNVHADPAKIA